MLDGQFLRGVGAVRELRPTEDLSLMHDYELKARFDPATIRTLKLAGETAVGESFRLVGAPLAAEPEWTADTPVRAASTPSSARESVNKGVEERAAQRVDRPAKAAEASELDLRQSGTTRDDGLASTDVAPADRVALPYGFDPTRVRQLVEGIVDVRAVSAIVVAPRPAGDLTDVAAADSERRRLITVAPTERLTG